MKILGMPLWRENISDEQYVERTRKRLKAGRKWRYLTTAMGLVILCMVFWLISMTMKFLGEMNNDLGHLTGHGVHNSQSQAVYAIYGVAIVMGYLTGFMLFNALSHITMNLYDYRKDKMLVEFWDALSDAEKSRLRQKSS